MGSDVSEACTFNYLAISCLEIVTQIKFKNVSTFGDENASDLSKEFTLLADRLVKNSKVLLDFSGVTSFNSSSINELMLFNLKLRTKGSRVVLCCLSPEVHQSFFAKSNGHE